MTFLPIFERELRSRSRARATYWMRVGIAAVALLICLPQLAYQSPFMPPAAVGKSMFGGLIIAGFILSCCSCFLTVAAISHERNEGTLGFLLLTRVRVTDILLGKLGSVGITSLCALVAFSPVIMLPVLAGGVSGADAFRKSLVLLNTMFFSLAAGLLAAAAEPSAGKAARNAAALVILALLVPLFFWATNPLKALGVLSPLVSLICADELKSGRASAGYFCCSLLAVHLFGWLLLLAAAVRLRRNLLELVPRVMPQPQELSAIADLQARRWRYELARIPPVEWLVCRQPGSRAAVWAVAILILLTQNYLPFLGGFGGIPFFGPFVFYPFVVSAVTGVLLAWTSSRFFIGARRTGLLELLLTTPAGAAGIVSDQWRGLQRILVLPMLVILLPVFSRAFAMLTSSSHGPGSSQLFFASFTPLFNALYLVMLGANMVLSVLAVCWVGLFFGLRARNQATAIAWTVGMARGAPYVLWWLLFLLISSPRIPAGQFSLAVNVVFYPATYLAGFLLLMVVAKRLLRRELARVRLAPELGSGFFSLRGNLPRDCAKPRRNASPI